MVLRRMGKKDRKTGQRIISLFPEHSCYIEMFCGALGLFYQKEKAKYNILNDLDEDVFNLYSVVRGRNEELYKELYNTPYSSSIFKYFRKNKFDDPIYKAVRFLYLSNFSFMGKMGVLKIGNCDNSKKIALENLEPTKRLLQNTVICNYDFRVLLDKVSFNKKNKVFIYADPPYLSTANNYSNSWKKKDAVDLFETLINSKIRFAISEFKNPEIVELAKKYELKIIEIGERRTIQNRNVEILIVNYEP